MLGQTLNGRYKLTRILGAGGFGQTYLAVDLATNLATNVATDLAANGNPDLSPDLISDLSPDPAIATQPSHQKPCVVKHLKPASQDQTFLTVARRLFDTESKTLKKLGSHPQIPTSIDFFEEDNEFYLVQEFIDGQSLEDEIDQAGKFTEAQAIALLETVLPVLGFVHKNHVIHRDLKPDNLIRRPSGEIVLIDFGAVKEIRTHLITGEKTGLTIGIGTQGYTPSEQLSGKPRYSSDIYALGMTVIHALTGCTPADLPETLNSIEPVWQDITEISPGLAILLSKMTRHYIHQRYQTVEAVQRDLKRLDELPAEAAAAVTCLETTLPLASLDTEAKTVIVRWRMGYRARLITVAISTLVTSICILGLRQRGVFVPAELAFWDKMVSAQKEQGPDPRLLIVEITAADLDSPASFSPADTALAQVIDNLQAHAPARIAIDLLDPQLAGKGPTDEGSADEGTEHLQESLKNPSVLVVTKLSDPDKASSGTASVIPPPPGMRAEQLSFSNLVVDPDFRVRRSLMLDFSSEVGNETQLIGLSGEQPVSDSVSAVDQTLKENLAIAPVEQPIFSLGTEAAIHYLKNYENIEPAGGKILQMGSVRFNPISPSFGGYQNVNTRGYQMFMRYRASENIAKRLSFSDVKSNRFNPALIKDKIVFIGAMTDSNDTFLTPYNTGGNPRQMHDVEIHAQVTSQILTAVLEGETLPWAWDDRLEILWIVALTGIGSTLMVLTQKGPILIFFGVSGLALAFGVSVVSFHAGGWVPVAAPMSAFFCSAAGTRISKSYQRRHWEARQSED